MVPSLNVLITSAYGNVSWITSLRAAAETLGVSLRTFATCSEPELSPSCLLADSAIALPPVPDPFYIERLLEVCVRFQIGLLLPGSPRELLKLAVARSLFEAIGTRVVVGGHGFVSLTRDPLAVDRIAVKAGASPRGLVSRAEVARSPRTYDWPMEVLPRKWLNEELGTLRLHHHRELPRLPKSTPLLMTPLRRGGKTVVFAFFDDGGGLAWRGAVRAGTLEASGIRFAETIEHAAATALVDRIAPQLREAYGPVSFVFRDDRRGGLVLEKMIPVPPKELPLVDRAGSRLSHRLLLAGIGSKAQPETQWHAGLRLLFYPAAMVLMRGQAAEAMRAPQAAGLEA